MLKSVPWDVWIATLLALAVGLVAFFDWGPAVFIAIYLALCAYIAIQTFGPSATDNRDE